MGSQQHPASRHCFSLMPAYPQSDQVLTMLGQAAGLSWPGFGEEGGLLASVPLNTSFIKLSPCPENFRISRCTVHSPKNTAAAGRRMAMARGRPRRRMAGAV